MAVSILVEQPIEQRPEQKDDQCDRAEYNDYPQQDRKEDFERFDLFPFVRNDGHVAVCRIKHPALDVDHLVAEFV